HSDVGNNQINFPVLQKLYSFLPRVDSKSVNPHGTEKRPLQIHDSRFIVDHERSAAQDQGRGLFSLLIGPARNLVGRIRKGNRESRASLPISRGYLAVVFLYYSIAHTQSQSSAPAGLFG